MTQPDPPENPPTSKAKVKKPGRWRRRIIVLLIAFICVVLIFRFVLTLLLPTVMNKVAKVYGLQCTYDRLDLSLIGGSAAIWNFQVVPIEGGDPLFSADYCQGDISVSGLLKGRLVVYRAAADGVAVTVQRNADGHIPLLDRFVSKSSAVQSTKEPAANPPSASDLLPPLRIDALRLEHIRARFHDLFVQPNVDARLALDLRLSDLGTPGASTRFELDFSSDPILDTLRIEGRATGDQKQLSANLDILMRGLHLKPAQGYLAAIGLRPTADNISATMAGNFTANVAANPADGIQANLTLDHGRITSDGADAATLDHLVLSVDSLSAGSARIGKLSIDGVRCNAGRNADGSLTVGGVELVPVPPSPPVIAKTASTPVAASSFQWGIRQFQLTGLHLGFVDQAITPPVVLALDSPRIEVDNWVSSPPDSAANFFVELASPGIVREIRISGRATPFSETKLFNLTTEAKGISLAAVEPYLNAAGLDSEWKDGSFSVAADGSMSVDPKGKLTAHARLADLRVADGAELLSMKGVVIKGVSVDPQTRTLRADAIDVTGPALGLHRDGSGNFHFLAIKTRAAIAAAQPQPASPSKAGSLPNANAATEPSPAAFDNFELGHFGWKGVNISMIDDAVSPPAKLSVADAGFTVDDLSVHLKPGAPIKRGRFKAWLVVPQLASRLSLDGTVTPASDQTRGDFEIRGEGIHGDSIVAYLKPLGIEPVLKDGSIDVQGKVSLDSHGDQPRFSLSCSNLKYADGSQTLASVVGIGIDGVRAGSSGISVDSIVVQSPHTRVIRGADGIVEAGGVRFVARPAAPQSSADPPAAEPSTQPAAPSAFSAALKSMKISDVGVDWIDQSVQPGVKTTLHLGVGLQDFVFGSDSHPAPLHVTASVDGSVDKFTADGALAASPTSKSLRLDVKANGVRAGRGAAYLPPNVRSILKSGVFRTAITADVLQNSKGGNSVDVSVKDLDYRDADDAQSLLSFDSFHLKAPRLDPNANVVAVDDLTLDGFRTNICKTATGIDLLGFELVPGVKPKAVADPPPAQMASAPVTPATQPAGQNVMRQIAAQRAKLPFVTLQNLNLVASKISFIDTTKAGAKPLIVSDLRLRNSKPIALLGNDPESNAQAEFDLTGRIDPVADKLNLTAKISPFTRQRTVGLELTISGIHGHALAELDPGLASTIDGEQLEHGELRASLSATLKLQTIRATDFDFSHGGKLDFSLTNLAFRSDPSGPILAGIGEIHSEGIVLGPNLASVDCRELEIDNLIGRAEKKSDGLHVLGLIVKSPTTRPAADASPVVASSVAATPGVALQPPVSSSPPANEFKIDRLLVSGIDFRVEDQTSNPPTVIPVNGLDVEVQGLSNLDVVEDKPIRFNILASADKVQLASTEAGASVNRELFSQMAGSGVVSLYPQLKGWTKVSLNGFELTGIRGLAATKKIEIGAGTFDTDVDLRFAGDGSIDTSSRFIFTDLSLTEPPSGFISHSLGLPVSLDAAIIVLQDQDGSITVPLNFTLPQGHVSSVSIVSAGVGALAQIIATAVASAPLKVTNLLGLNSKPDAQPPVQLSFPAGYSALGPDQIALLGPLVERLRKDDSLQVTLRCDSGRKDVALAKERVNPSAEDALVLAGSLARRREALLAARLDAASQVRALLASTDSEDAARVIERLRTIDRQLYDTENAMDHAYDLLRPGAERQASRRTRAATLAIAKSRLEAVQNFLLRPGRNAIVADRVHIANPQFVESPENDEGTVTITVLKTK